MISSGRVIRFLFLFIISPVADLLANSEVLFYSPSENLMEQNRRYFEKQVSERRSYISLDGRYDLYDGDTRKLIGQINIPTIYFNKHPFVFRRALNVSGRDSLHYILHLERVTGRILIRINGDSLYEGSRNFLPYQIPVPWNLLDSGETLLEITVFPWKIGGDMFPHWMPVNLPRINNGIGGHIFLEQIPSCYIGNLRIDTPDFSGGISLTGEVVVRRSERKNRELHLKLQLLRRGEEKASLQVPLNMDSTDLEIAVPFKLPVDTVRTWTPEEPQKDELRVQIFSGARLEDELTRPLALREISLKGKQLYVNDLPVKISGLNYIYQDARGAALFDRNLILQDLQNLQKNGFNAIRLGYFPQYPRFYDLTDSLGILCFQDLPFPYFTVNLLDDSLQMTKFLNYVTEFQAIAMQHPSVVGIGLGSFFTESRTISTADLNALHRLLSAGGHFLVYTTTFDPSFLAGDLVDIVFLNILDRNSPEEVLNKLDKSNFPDKPVFISAFSKPLSYRIDSTRMTYDIRQIGELYRTSMLPRWRENFAGQFLFTYSDYFLEMPSVQAGINRQSGCQMNSIGLYTLDRALKEDADAVIKHQWGILQNGADDLEDKDFGTYLFIIVGLLNLFLFLFIYRSFIDFRKNIIRSFRRPHGFFVELLERRLISYEQSLILMFVLSVNAAVMLGGIIYFFRNNLLSDFFLTLIIPNAALKMYACQLTWQPILLVPFLIFTVIFIFILLTIPIFFISFIHRSRIRFRQAIATGVWAASPFLLMLPFGMFFYNLLVVMNSYWIFLLVLLYFHVWYFLRWLNGTRVMAGWSYPRVFLYAVFLFIVVGGGLFFYLQTRENLLLHLNVWTQLFYFHI